MYGHIFISLANLSKAVLKASAPGDSTIVIALGGYHSCIIATGGGVKCWGSNGNGQLGIGSNIHATRPLDVAGASRRSLAVIRQ